MASLLMRRILAALVAVVAAAGGEAFSQAPAPLATRRLALLIGVQQYPHLSEREQLDGCLNDVELMRRTLIERLGFQGEDVTVLTNQQATGDGIRRALKSLAQRANATAGPVQVVLHFSGHGSQVADQPPNHPDADEPDGLDETLVPFDATHQGSAADIRDDELFDFANSICAGKNVRLWCVLDCCHSGSGMRGVTRFRQLHRDVVVARPGTTTPAEALRQKQLPAGAVVLSACRAHEVEPEYQQDDQHYGLLSRFLAQVLNERRDDSPLTYRDLVDSIVARYRRDSAVVQAPTPQIEADPATLSENVGGGILLAGEHRWVKVLPIERQPGQVRLSAGALHGVTTGSLYELYGRPEDIVPFPNASAANNRALAWIRIDAVQGTHATASVLRRDGELLATSQLPLSFEAGVAIERTHEPGDFRLRIRVESIDREGQALSASETIPGAVHRALNRAGDAKESPWITWTTGSAPCDVVLRVDRDFAAVFPATGRPGIKSRESASSPGLRGGWGPIDLRQPDADRQLFDLLRRITRARNLMRVAAQPVGSKTDAPQIRIELLGIEIDANKRITRTWPLAPVVDENQQDRLVMTNGSLYTVRVTNLEPRDIGRPAYVTVLGVTGDMGIDVLFPYQVGGDPSEEQRIAAGESKISGPWRCGSASGSAPGTRSAIAISTREARNEFYLLAQPDLPVTRSSGTSMIQQLMEEQTFFRTRAGFSRVKRPQSEESAWSTTRMDWSATE